MRRIIWTRRARADLESIRDYIGQFAPLAAHRFALRLVATAESLAEHPLRGRPAASGSRELTVVSPYLIRYRVIEGAIEVLTIRHGARRS